jgi:LAO/AO transport system kinase
MDGAALAEAVIAGDRRALSRAVTLVESGRADHRAAALRLGAAVRAAGRQALRLGITGTPGVGKSTFIETLGLHLAGQGLRIAVLAVDPSSARSGGSILGDKTRMQRLARAPEVFIRPSPSQGALGGVARRTREVLALVEAAGFDLAIVETVGVGQSETLVAELTDLFVLLLAPGGGDELQGVKRGIMERADMVLVNKADGPRRDEAERTRADYAAALRLMRRREGDGPAGPEVRTVSAMTGAGVAEAWAALRALAEMRRATGFLAARREAQAQAAFAAELRDGLLAWAMARPDLAAEALQAETAVAAGRLSPEAAAAAVLAALQGG